MLDDEHVFLCYFLAFSLWNQRGFMVLFIMFERFLVFCVFFSLVLSNVKRKDKQDGVLLQLFSSTQIFMLVVWNLYATFHNSILSWAVRCWETTHSYAASILTYTQVPTNLLLISSLLRCLKTILKSGLLAPFFQIPASYYMIIQSWVECAQHIRAIKL